MNHATQPKSSYWCWAACLSKMIKGLRAPSRIGQKQCELVSFYKDDLVIDRNPLGVVCCSSSNLIPDGCNLALDENHLENVFKEGGFITKEIDKLFKLDSFQFIKYTLKANQSPIVLKTRTGGFGHMVLLNGYGEKDGCEYILASNPIGAIGERYMEFNYFKTQIKIERAWETVVKVEKNLVLDQKINDSVMIIENFINKNIRPHKRNSPVLDAWNYLTSEHLPEIAHQILLGEFENISKEEFINKLEKDFKAETAGVCEPTVHRDMVNLGEINFITEENLDRMNFELRKNNQSYFEKYATKVEIKKEAGEIKVKPISWPANYTLNESWQSYDDFKEDLMKKSNPSIQYFTEIDHLRPREAFLTM